MDRRKAADVANPAPPGEGGLDEDCSWRIRVAVGLMTHLCAGSNNLDRGRQLWHRACMRLKDIVKAPKRIVGMQKGDGSKRMPRTAFPLSRNQSFRPGLGWDWWSIEFDVEANAVASL